MWQNISQPWKCRKLTHATIWMNPYVTVISDVSQTLRDKYCVCTYTRYLGGGIIATEGRMEALGQAVKDGSLLMMGELTCVWSHGKPWKGWWLKTPQHCKCVPCHWIIVQGGYNGKLCIVYVLPQLNVFFKSTSEGLGIYFRGGTLEQHSLDPQYHKKTKTSPKFRSQG